MPGRIYLDNAATSWPKPPGVVEAMSNYYVQNGASAGRGASANSAKSERILAQTRTEIARRIGVSQSSQIVFTSNATDALNLAIHGWVRAGDHVASTMAEHNSVARPLFYLEHHQHVSIDWVTGGPMGVIDVEDLEYRLSKNKTRLFCFSAVSNVTGILQPVEQISEICQRLQVPVLCDAAQALGHFDEELSRCDFDFVASSGHKGLLGPQGTGFLFVGNNVKEELMPLRQGGTGLRSEQKDQPEDFPARLESGTQNVGGIAGLLASLKFLETDEATRSQDRCQQLINKLREQLARIKNVTLYPDPSNFDGHQTEIVSFNLGGLEPQSVAAILESSFGIEVRAGFHCSPLMHEQLGTTGQGGTVRISPGLFNSEADIDTLLSAIQQIAKTSNA